MIDALKGPKNFNLRRYAIGKLAHDIDTAFCQHFKTERVYYYLESCTQRRHYSDGKREVCACGTHRIIWHGEGLIGFIHRAQNLCHKEQNAPVLFVTTHKTKNPIVCHRHVIKSLAEQNNNNYDLLWSMQSKGIWYNNPSYLATRSVIAELSAAINQAEQALNTVEYWIGDVASNGNMICCDPMFGYLWQELHR